MNNYKIRDYVYDITRLKPDSMYAGNAILAVLWIAGFVGILGYILPNSGITEFLYQLSTLSHP
jgi:hypothetical protein